MQCIASFIDPSPLIRLEAAISEIAEQFAMFADATVFAVAHKGRIVGMIERRTIDLALRAGHGADGIRHLITADPMVVDARSDARAVLRAALHTGEGVAVVEGDDYLGMASLSRALDALLDSSEPVSNDEANGVARAAEAELRGQIDGLLAMAGRLSRQHLHADAMAQVQSIVSTGKALLRIADDCRDLVLARRGRLELKPTPQRLREVIDTVQARWAGPAADIGLSLLISYDGDPDVSAVVDADRLMQVFDNLIDNALRYTRQGSVEVSLRARAENDQVMLEGRVRDTGPGMAGADPARLFEIEAGEGGSLPLALTGGIVTAMGGSIRAHGNRGQGMTIVFDMTVGLAQAVAASSVAQISQVSGVPHILVVDDNATNRMVAEALCEMFNCTSETAQDGLEAVEAVRSGRFDLVLMDIKMPRMDGIAATHAIRALGGPIGAAPIIALTANADPEDARGYLAAGMCAVVEKPIKPDRLLQAINAALASSAGPAQAHRVAAA